MCVCFKQDCEDCIKLEPTFSKLEFNEYEVHIISFYSVERVRIITLFQPVCPQLRVTPVKELPWRL